VPTLTSKTIRVLIVDDHALMRAGLRVLLESQPGLAVVGEAANRREALTMASHTQPDIILLDLCFDDDISLDLISELLATAKAARILILTGIRNPEIHRVAVRMGAMGLVLKEKAVDVLTKAIERVYAGEVWLERSMIASVLDEMTRPGEPEPLDPAVARIATLSPREREVIALIGEGLKNRQVAERLFVSETTVRHHLTSIFDKLGVPDRLGLLIYAYRYNLARPSH